VRYLHLVFAKNSQRVLRLLRFGGWPRLYLRSVAMEEITVEGRSPEPKALWLYTQKDAEICCGIFQKSRAKRHDRKIIFSLVTHLLFFIRFGNLINMGAPSSAA
jgi:hypothetical protein